MSSPARMIPWQRIILEAFILCVLAVAVGLSLNFNLIFNAFSGAVISVPQDANLVVATESSEPFAPALAFPIPVSLNEVDELLASGAILVDARTSHAYTQSHLAGALSLPYADLDNRLAAFKQLVSLGETLITYCSGYGCSDSFDLGERLLQEGYTDVLVYEGGVPEWQSAGRPLVGGEE
ncbi:Rhodanese-related sulfurtransferase [Desulfuromusa kysingii]|uniref:Rhodanese-related sulfurtransferase n=1 Tax=Desulfuromusa kysingii TaxID=37625 RepID=A0A1H3W647_9BACT|nr:rhodanese-like domain-containing protein [Desulfuromusa kysingii]SDZ82565.1 Rhodanese-related sulfurtransferase [Desulfuromusa kysingii]